MTDTIPAATRALPFDAQNLIALLAASSAQTAGIEQQGAGHDQTADARLIELTKLYAQRTAEQDVLEHAVDEAHGRYEAPQIPEALRWRQDDFLDICIDTRRLPVQMTAGQPVPIYDDARFLDGLREKVAFASGPDFIGSRDYILRRAAEIFAAKASLDAQRLQAGRESGVMDAVLAANAGSYRLDEIRRDIAHLPATTTAGFAAKAEVAMSIYAFGTIAGQAAPELLESAIEGAMRQELDWSEALGLSLSIDAAALAATAPATEARSAA